MSHDLVFLYGSVLVTFVLVMPVLSLVARAVLKGKRDSLQDWADYGSETVFAWLVAPTLLPLTALSSLLVGYYSDAVAAEGSCLLGASPHIPCVETWIGLAAILLVGLTVVGRRFRLELSPWKCPTPCCEHSHASVVAAREVVDRIVAGRPCLRPLRLVVVEGSSRPIYSIGCLRPFVVVDACFVHQVDEDALEAALLHEWAHVVHRDMLRSFMVRLFFSLNPARVLLMKHYRHWSQAREAACDAFAVSAGADTLALAQALLKAARFRCEWVSSDASRLEPVAAPVQPAVRPVEYASLCACSQDVLKLRIALLLDGPVKPLRTYGHQTLGFWVLSSIVVPHFMRYLWRTEFADILLGVSLL